MDYTIKSRYNIEFTSCEMSRAGKCKDTGSAWVTARDIRKRILEHTVNKDVAVSGNILESQSGNGHRAQKTHESQLKCWSLQEKSPKYTLCNDHLWISSHCLMLGTSWKILARKINEVHSILSHFTPPWLLCEKDISHDLYIICCFVLGFIRAVLLLLFFDFSGSDCPI